VCRPAKQAGILETLLDRLADRTRRRSSPIKSKIKAALFYPIAIIAGRLPKIISG